MKLHCDIYRCTSTGTVLKFIGVSNCTVYVPECQNQGNASAAEPHITFDLGNTQLMFDLAEFKALARKVLDTEVTVSQPNPVKLRLVKG